MKALVLIAVLAVICVVLFVTGVLAPRRSRRMQRSVDRLTKKAQGKGERNGGKAGDFGANTVKRMRHAADRSAKKGRDLHDRLTS